eukprot:338630_1
MALSNELILEQQLEDLTDKYETLEHTASLLELEKEEYQKELSKIKQQNIDLTQKNEKAMKFITEMQQEKRLLTKSYTVKAIDLDMLNYKNTETTTKLKQNIKNTHRLHEEYEIIKQQNEKYKMDLENHLEEIQKKEQEKINQKNIFINQI